MDEQQRVRIRDDLRGFFKGELLFEETERLPYATDASIFQVMPLGVALPRDEEDVRLLVRYAAEQGVPLVPRGAGTGLAGEALGSGLIVDLSRHFRAILDRTEDHVRVQPGVVLDHLQRFLAKYGRRFAPNPSSGRTCTLGGMLANNASGGQAGRAGYTDRHVDSLRVVLDTGEAAEVRRLPWPLSEQQAPAHWNDIVESLGYLLEQHQELLAGSPRRTPFDRCGYPLAEVLGDGRLDLPRLLIGSEGTLGIFTEATLRTVPLPGGRSTVLLACRSLDQALEAGATIADFGPHACDLMDRRLVSLVREREGGRAIASIPPGAEAVLLVEFQGETQQESQRRAEETAGALVRQGKGVFFVRVAREAGEQEEVWRLREEALPSLYDFKGGPQPLPFVEDCAVPRERLGDFLHGVQDILQEFETTGSFLVHVLTGQVHTRPFLDLSRPEHVSRLMPLAERLHVLALEMGGTICSQHGLGLARTPWVARQMGPRYPLLRQIKAIFDPRGLFNPGKIVDPDPARPAWPLRPPLRADLPPTRLRWPLVDLATEASHCNGCGHCRTETPEGRMCPIFRALPIEAATPRAKANLVRHVLQEGTDPGSLAAEQVRSVAEWCVNCRMCALECPARVNIPKLMLEAKAANFAEHGALRGDGLFAALESMVRFGSALSLLTNLVLGSPSLRWVLEKATGLSRRRRLPRLAHRTFLQTAHRRGWTRRPRGTRPRVVYFPDLYAIYFDPQIAEAAVLVLQHHGFDVWVPTTPGGSGLEALAHGDVDTARDRALRHLRVLAEPAREGHPIVCTEPGAALMLGKDWLNLVDDPDARLVAARTVEMTAFLDDLRRRGRFRTDFRSLPLSVGHHVPCHLKALEQGIAGPGLLQAIPELKVRTLDVGCSGMAGTFGLKARHRDLSLAAGRTMLTAFRADDLAVGASECSACRLQMQDASRKRVLHPVQYLALAYGLLPEVERRLREPIRKRSLLV